VALTPHDVDTQFHCGHVSPVGPVVVPAWHVPVVAHQPQAERCEHETQSVDVLQFLMGATVVVEPLLAQVDETQLQPVEQVDPVGPEFEPVRQVPVDPHHPHAARWEQETQLTEELQGSVALTPQVEETQFH